MLQLGYAEQHRPAEGGNVGYGHDGGDDDAEVPPVGMNTFDIEIRGGVAGVSA